MGKNDERIIQLKEGIAKKKEELGKVKKFTPVTNCALMIGGQSINIHTLDLARATNILIDLNIVRMSIEDLDLTDYKYGGVHTVEEWMTDIKAKMDVLKVKDEEAKLREMERTLDKLMSEEKRTELELDSIAEMLK